MSVGISSLGIAEWSTREYTPLAFHGRGVGVRGKPRVTKSPLSHFMMAIYSAIDCVMTEKGGGRRYGCIPYSGMVTGEILDFAIPNSRWGGWGGGGAVLKCVERFQGCWKGYLLL